MIAEATGLAHDFYVVVLVLGVELFVLGVVEWVRQSRERP